MIAVVLALGVMPLNLWIYTRYWAKLAVAIPYKNLLVTLVATVIPASLGYLVLWRKPKAVSVLAKVIFHINIYIFIYRRFNPWLWLSADCLTIKSYETSRSTASTTSLQRELDNNRIINTCSYLFLSCLCECSGL